MKEYAVLKVSDDLYILLDEFENIILSDWLPKRNRIYEESMVLNILTKEGWDVEYIIEKNNIFHWYMMSKIQNNKP